MASSPSLPAVQMACFRIEPAGPQVPVMFNPASLECSVSNEMKAQKGNRKKQYVEKSKASLKMQLLFDTTDTGHDVRAHTASVSRLLQPVQGNGKPVPPTVTFEWGSYAFTGMVEQYREVLDFFAAEGVPLRATVDLVLGDQDFQFPDAERGGGEAGIGAGASIVASAGGAFDVAARLGDPRAARSIASANGQASLRAGAGAGMAVGGGAGVSLQGEAGFSAGASAGIGFGAGASAGVGLQAGAGASAGAGIGIGAGAGGGTAAAFAGLRASVPSPSLPPPASALFSAGASAGIAGGFGIGGKAGAGIGGLSADVGAEADLNALIRFG